MQPSSTCDQTNRSYWAAILSCCVVYFALQDGLTFEFVCKTAWSATIQMKATEQYVAVVLYILLYVQGAIHIKSVDKIIKCGQTDESYRAVLLLFTMLYNVVLNLKSVDETLVCDHSNKNYWAVLSSGTVYYAVQGVSKFLVCGWNLSCDHTNESYLAVLLLFSFFCGSVSFSIGGGSKCYHLFFIVLLDYLSQRFQEWLTYRCL